MIQICITIEGSNGLTWPVWQRLVKTVEDVGFHGLYRSDHLTGNQPPDQAALELWVSLTWLADHSRRIEFGPLVSPVSFRHPVLTAKMATAVDDLSAGRLVLGVGAGGWEREHQMYGFESVNPRERIERLVEGVNVLHRLFHNDDPVDYSGEYYRLQQAILLPRPQRPGGPPLLIGGLGKKVTLPLAARFADEWNGVYLTVERFHELNMYLDDLITKQNRAPNDVKRSILTGCIYGENRSEVNDKARRWLPQELNEEQNKAVIRGGSAEIVDQISMLEIAGVQKVMLVWFDLEDFEGLEKMAKKILPRFQRH